MSVRRARARRARAHFGGVCVAGVPQQSVGRREPVGTWLIVHFGAAPPDERALRNGRVGDATGPAQSLDEPQAWPFIEREALGPAGRVLRGAAQVLACFKLDDRSLVTEREEAA